MKNYKNFLISCFVSFFCLTATLAQSETLEELVNEVSSIQTELKSLSTSSLEEAIVIDNAIKVIDQVANLVTESISRGDTAAALSTINFLNESIGDIISQTPKNFITEKTESDLSAFNKKDMKEIQTITQSMKVRKQEKMETLVQDMAVVSEKGVDALEISKELNTIGVETIAPEEVKAVAKTISKNQIQSLTEIKTVTEATKEIKPEETYAAFVGETEEEVSMSLRQVEVLQSGDNAKQRAFDIEKYGKIYGLSDAEIKQGVSAVKAGDWEGQKETMGKIFELAGLEVTEAELNTEMEHEIINDVALNAIMDGKGKKGEELAQEVKSILSKNISLSENTIERVYYTVKGGVDNVWAEPGTEISYNDIAAEVKAEMSEDPDIERAYYATKPRWQGYDWSDALKDHAIYDHLYKESTEAVERSEEIEVAAEVQAILSGDNDKQVEFYTVQSSQWKGYDWSDALKDHSIYDDAAKKASSETATDWTGWAEGTHLEEAAKQASSETTEAVSEVAQEAATETTEAVAEVAQEAAAETTEAVAEVAQEAASETTEAVAEISQEVAEEVQEVAQEVAEEVQEVAQEVAEEVQEVAQEVAEEVQEVAQEVAKEITEEIQEVVQEVQKTATELSAEWNDASNEFLDVWEDYQAGNATAAEVGAAKTKKDNAAAEYVIQSKKESGN